MAILAECPMCHTKQKVKNKVCKCGTDLDKAKKSNKVDYWVTYFIPKGKEGDKYLYEQHRELVGKSISDAKAADGKRKGQKKENRIFDIKPDCKMTFTELARWYLDLEKVKGLKYYPTLQTFLDKFNKEFGAMVVSDIKPADIENLQAKRKKGGLADSTIDEEITIAKIMINKAFDNDLVSGDTLKAFKRVKRVMVNRNANARKRILSLEEFNKLNQYLSLHTKWALTIGFYTGMRLGEILSLTWDKVSLPNRVIRLEAKDTKDKEPREIPICDELHTVLRAIPRSLHDNHVILFNGKPIKKYIHGSLVKACKDAGITYGRLVKDGFIFHDLRHTFNTLMRKTGVPESVIMSITGHSTREMFDRYNTVDMEDKRQAINQYQVFLRGQKSANEV